MSALLVSFVILYTIGQKPTQVFDKIFEDCGGIMGASSCGYLPRNKKQVSNLKVTAKPVSEDYDPLFALMEQCKKENHN